MGHAIIPWTLRIMFSPLQLGGHLLEGHSYLDEAGNEYYNPYDPSEADNNKANMDIDPYEPGDSYNDSDG